MNNGMKGSCTSAIWEAGEAASSEVEAAGLPQSGTICSKNVRGKRWKRKGAASHALLHVSNIQHKVVNVR